MNLKFVRKFERIYPNVTLKELPIRRIHKCKTMVTPVDASKMQRLRMRRDLSGKLVSKETEQRSLHKKASEVSEPELPMFQSN